MTCILCAHVGVPQPYWARNAGSFGPGISNPTTSTPPAPASAIWPTSVRNSASSTYAPGSHHRYFGRTDAGGLANDADVTEGAWSAAAAGRAAASAGPDACAPAVSPAATNAAVKASAAARGTRLGSARRRSRAVLVRRFMDAPVS